MDRVYPRVCGGTGWLVGCAIKQSGLSPRVRGNLSALPSSTIAARSIPACAGEPTRPCSEVRTPTVYPRVCGGTTVPPRAPPVKLGLSPRVRGNRLPLVQNELIPGSIPACAGEPAPNPMTAKTSAVYPRVCGGTYITSKVFRNSVGLSPRVRGNLEVVRLADGHIGSIPACAGEPHQQSPTRGLRTVYPRVCGGISFANEGGACVQGLSPRVRGNRLYSRDDGATGGSIPACAGEPSRRPSMSWYRTVYPRVCGGTVRLSSSAGASSGLSPRVRGNRTRLEKEARPDGSIPACAGEPSASQRRN